MVEKGHIQDLKYRQDQGLSEKQLKILGASGPKAGRASGSQKEDQGRITERRAQRGPVTGPGQGKRLSVSVR